LIPKD